MMNLITKILLSLCLLLPMTTFGETMDDLVVRDGIYYKQFTDVPFTGEITGKPKGKIKNGKKDGLWIYYDYNEQLLGKGTYKHGTKEGPWVVYYNTGQLRGKGTYKNGKWDGPWVSYYENGQLWMKGTYKDGKKEDDWVYYSPDGSVSEQGED